MNIKNALLLLELPELYNENDLKKAYYKKCLQYHPDKNPNGLEMFKNIQEAYNYLQTKNCYKYTFDKNKNGEGDCDCEAQCQGKNENENEKYEFESYSSLLKKYIETFSEKYNWNSEDIYTVLSDVLKNAKNISLKMFMKLDKDTSLDIFDYMTKYKNLFNISDETMNDLYQHIHKEFDNSNTIILNPTFEELYNDGIFVLKEKENTFYVPLWHNELHFKDNCIVRIFPKIPKNMYIDDNNNLHITIYENIENLLKNPIYNYEVGEKSFLIETHKLYIQKYQTYILKNQGLSKIDEKNIFNNKKKSNIVFHIHLH
jgi:hypothetical protein